MCPEKCIIQNCEASYLFFFFFLLTINFPHRLKMRKKTFFFFYLVLYFLLHFQLKFSLICMMYLNSFEFNFFINLKPEQHKGFERKTKIYFFHFNIFMKVYDFIKKIFVKFLFNNFFFYFFGVEKKNWTARPNWVTIRCRYRKYYVW